MREPLVSSQTVRERLRVADQKWEAAVRAFDLYPTRLRTLADAADGHSRVIRLAELAEMPWKPRDAEFTIALAAELGPDVSRPGPPRVWAEFDRDLESLEQAMRTDSNRGVSDAFEALRDRLLELADAIEAAAAVGERQTG